MQKLFSSRLAALVCAAFMAPAAYAAETKPSVIIAGKGQVLAYSYSNDKNVVDPAECAKGAGEYFSTAGSRIDFIVAGKTNVLNGLEYDFLVCLDGSPQSAAQIKTTRIRAITPYGTALVGNHMGIESMMPGTHTIMQGTGGFHGAYDAAVDVSDGVTLSADNPISSRIATKLTYQTVRVNGVSAGFSWAPLSHLGSIAPQPHRNALTGEGQYFRNNLILGADFKKEFENGIGLGLGGTWGKTDLHQSGKLKDIQYKPGHVWNISGKADYHGFSLGGGYQDASSLGEFKDLNQANQALSKVALAEAKKKGPATDANAPAPALFQFSGMSTGGQSWNVAAGYEIGDHAFGVGYLNNSRLSNGDEVGAEVYSLTYRYKIAPGLNAFAEINQAHMRTGKNARAFEKVKKDLLGSGTSVGSNTAHVFMVGTSVSF